MGYETRLILGNKFENSPRSKFEFGISKIATIDLSKICYNEMGVLISRIQNEENSKLYPRTFYYQGNKMVTKDNYGDALRLVPVHEVLDAMKEDNKKEPYRRFNMTIPFLEEAIKGFGDGELFCLLYGY